MKPKRALFQRDVAHRVGLHRERRRNELADAVESTALGDAAEIADLLRRTAIIPTMRPGEGDGA